MSIPCLVENNIKNVLNYNLHECHEIKMKMFSFVFNLSCFFVIFILLGIILYYKYKGQKNVYEKKKKENQKRDYILYNLRKFQNIKNKCMTNISFE